VVVSAQDSYKDLKEAPAAPIRSQISSMSLVDLASRSNFQIITWSPLRN
jgi:hypothetical protein